MLTELLHQQVQTAKHARNGAPHNGRLLSLQGPEDLHHSLQRGQASLGQSVGVCWRVKWVGMEVGEVKVRHESIHCKIV